MYRFEALVILFSKSLLRHASTVSAVSDLVGESHFLPVLQDPTHGTSIDAPESVRRVIFCSGQIYAALHARRDREGIRDTAITRLEELHPFPWSDVQDTLARYPNAESIVWAQEEPRNGGAWQYVRDRFKAVFPRTDAHREQRILYAGRPTAAATAVGIKSLHEAQQQQLLELAFSVQARQGGV
jgi:2-oxoglutarate dehydrogenase E1 component